MNTTGTTTFQQQATSPSIERSISHQQQQRTRFRFKGKHHNHHYIIRVGHFICRYCTSWYLRWTSNMDHLSSSSSSTTTTTTTAIVISPFVSLIAIVYILSGVCQPLLMIACTDAGLANSTAQLYMLFYYAGPSSMIVLSSVSLSCCTNLSLFSSTSSSSKWKQQQEQQQQQDHNNTTQLVTYPSMYAIGKAMMVACFDIIAQSLNYTGATLAGATIFAVIYSSVTIWTAIFSRIILLRSISYQQGVSIILVFIGLCITSLDSINLGNDVVHGTILILFGSCMHGATYVLSEAIMITSHGTTAMIHTTTTDDNDQDETSSIMVRNKRMPTTSRSLLTYQENSTIQGIAAFVAIFIWQFVYTIPHWETAIQQPAISAGTTIPYAMMLLLSFSVANLFHSLSFYYTVAHYPGGSTSAGVMKGLQAVCVFVVAHLLYCHTDTNNNTGGDRMMGQYHQHNNMCFSKVKFISLITVVGGVLLFRMTSLPVVPTFTICRKKTGYTKIDNTNSVMEC